MTGALKRKIMIGVAVLALLVGVVLAIVTASGSSDGPTRPQPRRAAGLPGASDLALAASYIGISRAQLRHELDAGSTLADVANATRGRSASGLMDALFAASAARLSAAVSAGKLSKSKQTTRLAKLPERLNTEIHRHHGLGAGPVDVATTARYLEITAGQIREAQRSGRSLAQIADSRRHRSAAGLIQTLVSAKKAALAAAVRAGTLSRAAQSKMTAALARRVTAEAHYRPPKRASGKN
jgi:hypothetical protein